MIEYYEACRAVYPRLREVARPCNCALQTLRTSLPVGEKLVTAKYTHVFEDVCKVFTCTALKRRRSISPTVVEFMDPDVMLSEALEREREEDEMHKKNIYQI